MSSWISAIIAIAGGLVLGAVAGRVTQQLLGAPSRPTAIREVAGALGSLVFSVVMIVGLVVALGFINEDARDQIPRDLIDFLPNVLSAIIVGVGANVAGRIAEATLERTFARGPGAVQRVPTLVRWTIVAFGVILAAAQLGVDTTTINIAVAALLFSLGLAAALMTGLGSRAVSAEVAAGRALRRMVATGDVLSFTPIVDGEPGEMISGEVVAIASVAIELRRDSDADGTETMLVPHSQVLASHISVRRQGGR